MAPIFSVLSHVSAATALGPRQEVACGCTSLAQVFPEPHSMRMQMLGRKKCLSGEFFVSRYGIPGTRWKQERSTAYHNAFVYTAEGSCMRPRNGRRVLQSDWSKGYILGSNRRVWKQKPACTKAASRPVLASASSSDAATRPSTSGGAGSSWLDIPGDLWKRLVHPLNDFGFGKRSIWEGGVGLFMATGGCLFLLVLAWIKGAQLQARTRRYEAIMEFSQACGIAVGTPVRIRGVDVGSVVALQPSLEKISVVAEIKDAGIVIPRNSLVEVNQHGLISETLIDITPRLPIPKPQHGPLDEECSSEGVIVCHRQRIKGEQGVSLDELVGVCTKIAKAMDQQGVHTMFEAANRVSLAVEEAKPLIEKVNAMAGDVGPLLKDLREGGVLDNLEKLLQVATEAARDLRQLNSSVLTPENTELLRQSVSTLTKTLKHVESISSDVSGLTGDPHTRYNLKQLIESLSRLISD